MILVNNPGGPWNVVFAPLLHADWIGLTPTDLVFPTFMFIMGITTYLSLRKFHFSWSLECAGKIAKRSLLLWGIGLAVAWLLDIAGQAASPDTHVNIAQSFSHLRILGVLPRLGICYGLAAVIAMTVKHKCIPWIIALIFIAYYAILELGNGYAHDSTNILAVIDYAVLGANHVFIWDTPDPEGLLSTLPSVAHVLIGFCVGEVVMNIKDLNDKIERMFVFGTLLMLAGALLAYLCPISKKLWTPTFSMLTCGIACTLLALMTWAIDKRRCQGRATELFRVFGVNPLALYVFSDLLVIPLAMLPLSGGQTIQAYIYNNVFTAILPPSWASLLWSVLYVMAIWAVGLLLYKKKIYIKL